MGKKEDQSVRRVAAADGGSQALFDLSSFALESSTLEIRYPFALNLWDRSGQLWRAAQEKWPEIVPLLAEPKKTDFKNGNARLVVEFEQARFSVVEPERSLEQFFKDSREFIGITTRYLQIATYKRVGFRLLYFKEFKDKKEAAEAFFSLQLLRMPDGRKFEIDGAPINPQYSLRWESEKKGVMLHLRSETRVVDVDPPPEAARFMKPFHKEMSGIVFDCDYYTVAAVEPGQMDTSEWMKHAMHIIARDSRFLFGG
jgi:hypothetical protein